ncbi:MAG: hypothetical protein PHD02_04220 [Bacilli bacterium]|nr:hypothetical protein [Bacilli bacterium]
MGDNIETLLRRKGLLTCWIEERTKLVLNDSISEVELDKIRIELLSFGMCLDFINQEICKIDSVKCSHLFVLDGRNKGRIECLKCGISNDGLSHHVLPIDSSQIKQLFNDIKIHEHCLRVDGKAELNFDLVFAIYCKLISKFPGIIDDDLQHYIEAAYYHSMNNKVPASREKRLGLGKR